MSNYTRSRNGNTHVCPKQFSPFLYVIQVRTVLTFCQICLTVFSSLKVPSFKFCEEIPCWAKFIFIRNEVSAVSSCRAEQVWLVFLVIVGFCFVFTHSLAHDMFSVTACLHMACVIKQKDIKQWCAELSVDTDKVGSKLVGASSIMTLPSLSCLLCL